MSPTDVATSRADHSSRGLAWRAVQAAAGEFATIVAARLRAHEHHVMATVRADGRPRVSGTTINLTDGRLWLGMMPGAARSADLRARPWCAVHSAPVNVTLPLGEGDVRLDADVEFLTDDDFMALLRAIGHDVERFDGSAAVELFVREIEMVEVDGDALVLTRWTPSGGVTTRRRA